ncbi:MAG: replicative DNA helicase [Candidatus Neomarinimicrobiota bacterium]
MAAEKNGELRLPPQNLEAEEAVLGAILIEKGAFDRVINFLPQGAFYKEAHNQIYAAMNELQNVGEPIDTLTLTNHLTRQGLLEKVGGAFYITGLAERVPSAANVGQYAQIVRERWSRRQIIAAGNEMIEEAFTGEQEVDDLLDTAEHRLFELQRKSTTIENVEIEGILHDSLSKLDQLHSADRRHRYTGIPAGYPDLDKMTNGFQLSDLVILAGRPSMGKTSLALNIARNAAGEEFRHRVGIFSMEMSNYQLAMRLLTAEAKVDSHKVRQGTLTKRDWPKISKAAGVLSEAPIFIDDTAGLDILGLRSRIRRFKADHAIEMVIIDYLQLISGRARMESRQQEMSDLTRSLKGLARELDITIMALSQLSRAPEQRPGKDKRPIMSDLRESGAIEQDADVILFLYRPVVYSRAEEDQGKAELIIAKQRNGPTGTINLTFEAAFTKFESAAFREDFEFVSEEEAPF